MADLESSLKILVDSIKITKGDKFDVCKLPTTNTIINVGSVDITVSEFGFPSRPPKPSKVLLLVGATGSGKTTWINRLANHLMGIDYDSKVRYMLIKEEERSQAHSQTQQVTVYKFHQSPLDYTLTVIDTPGFGGIGGPEREHEITAQIREVIFLSGSHSIDEIHGIGFMISANSARLDTSMKHLFQSIFSMLGKNTENVIFVLTSFWDGGEPLALTAMREANIPYVECFKFNNKALFDQEESTLGKLYWENSSRDFERFLFSFGSSPGVSLDQTREVLKQHGTLEDIQKSLRYQVKEIIEYLHQIEGHKEMLPQLSQVVSQKRHSMLTTVIVEKPLPEGVKVTNCTKCKYTCHSNCRCDTNKYWCRCINLQGYCRVCPGKCSHKYHVNNGIVYEQVKKEVIKKTRSFTDACDIKAAKEREIDTLVAQRERHQLQLRKKITEACEVQQQLNEIALKSSTLTETDFIDLLIESENKKQEPGWDIRILYYQQLKIEKEKEYIAQALTELPATPRERTAQLQENEVEFIRVRGDSEVSTRLQNLERTTSTCILDETEHDT